MLADAGYGSVPFRQALSARGLSWAVGISGRNKVYPADVTMIFPVAGRGRPRKRHVPDQVSVAAETILADMTGRSVTWRRGTKGRLQARFCALRVRMADGPTQRIGAMGNQHLPGDEVWLVREERGSASASTISQTCRPSHPQAAGSNDQGALDLRAGPPADEGGTRPRSLRGRSWTGLHRHALMTMMAYAFLQSRRLAAVGRKKRIACPPPQPSMPAIRQAILDHLSRPLARRCPHCDADLNPPP